MDFYSQVKSAVVFSKVFYAQMDEVDFSLVFAEICAIFHYESRKESDTIRRSENQRLFLKSSWVYFMSVEKEKKKPVPAESQGQKSKGLNSLLWVLSLVFVAVAAVGNVFLTEQFSAPIRIVAVVLLVLVGLGLAAITNQGTKARTFLKESRGELRKITWPNRQEATQTTLIVMGVTVFISLILWGLDSIIVSIITFLTELRF